MEREQRLKKWEDELEVRGSSAVSRDVDDGVYVFVDRKCVQAHCKGKVPEKQAHGSGADAAKAKAKPSSDAATPPRARLESSSDSDSDDD